MNNPLREYLLVCIFSVSVSVCSSAQEATRKESPRCCYPIISDVSNKIGFIDETGRVVVPPTLSLGPPSIEFLSPSDYRFSEGLAAIEVEQENLKMRDRGRRRRVSRVASDWQYRREPGKWGFIDQTGKMVIPPMYTIALNFSEGLAAVEVTSGEGPAREARWGFIDRTGKMVIAPEYTDAHRFSEGLAAVRIAPATGTGTNSKWGFIDQNGQVVIAPTYDKVLDFSGGLVAVYGSLRDQGKWGFIDKRGQMVTPPTDTIPPSFSEGLAAISLPNGKLGFINEQGRLMTTAFPFDETTRNAGIDSPFRSSDVESSPYDDLKLGEEPVFSAGRYPVRIGKKWGYIDKQGRLVIAPRFDVAGNFREGLASVGADGRAGFIDAQGKYVIPPKFRYARDFSDGLALVFIKRSYILLPTEADETREQRIVYGYVNHEGKVVFRGRNIFIDELQGGDTQEVVDFPRQVTVHIRSSPKKATIYLVPLATWDLEGNILNDDMKLAAYIQSRPTDYEDEVNQQVYMVILEYQGKRILRRLDAREQAVNEVNVEFNEKSYNLGPSTNQKAAHREPPTSRKQKSRRRRNPAN